MIREFEVLCVVGIGQKRKVLRHENPAMFEHGLEQFGEGEEVIVTVSEAGKDHTGKQRRFFHGPVLDAFVRLGWNRAAAKYHLCREYVPVEIRLPDDSIVIAPGHTSDLSRKRYNELIESAIQEAAERGEIVMSGEEWREERRREATEARKRAQKEQR